MINRKKISIMGIENAGKTSIVTMMKKKYDALEEIDKLKPTLRIERSSFNFLNQTFFVSDFGGQAKYREEYLKFADRHLAGSDIIIYLVDVKDTFTVDSSVKYLKDILNYYKEHNIDIQVVLCFHKLDPEFAKDPALQHNIENFKEKIKDEIDSFKFYFFNTSIYSIQTVISAFSFAVRLLYTPTQSVQEFLTSMSTKFKNTIGILVFDESGISLGEYYQDYLSVTLKKKILTLFEIALRRIQARNINFYEFSDRIDAFMKISGVIQTLEIKGLVFYIMLVLEEIDEESIITELDLFESFRSDFITILKSLVVEQPELQGQLNSNGND
jgi:GTPase SAR1 family protein